MTYIIRITQRKRGVSRVWAFIHPGRLPVPLLCARWLAIRWRAKV